MDYPLGGVERTENDVSAVALFDAVFDTDAFIPTTSGRLYPKGLIVSRLTADGKLTPFTTDDTPAGSGAPVGVMNSGMQATAFDELDVRFIVSGQVRLAELVIDDTSPSEVIDAAVKDLLRQTGIIPLATDELSKFDN